jgi:hypothetical protein
LARQCASARASAGPRDGWEVVDRLGYAWKVELSVRAAMAADGSVPARGEGNGAFYRPRAQPAVMAG